MRNITQLEVNYNTIRGELQHRKTYLDEDIGPRPHLLHLLVVSVLGEVVDLEPERLHVQLHAVLLGLLHALGAQDAGGDLRNRRATNRR